ncbi:MAG: prepilin-type N-terminal cleavage/methylation domain-containing protein [Candidatus Yonathbacteria bacterium]|nr:prepilin-type N-terminal cleavage/methylation domain-containing protein [Candidatus Yonathbacteria bacterium]
MTINNLNIMDRGFTLVETLVSIAILLIAIVGPISVIGDSVYRVYYAKDEIIAINLAQEGIEAVRQKRDSNMLAGSSWVTGLAAGYYIIDVMSTPAVISTSCTGACLTDLMPVYFDSTAGLYGQGSGFTVTTQFSRIVRIQAVTENTSERKVTSTVKWITGGKTGTISVVEHLFKTF